MTVDRSTRNPGGTHCSPLGIDLGTTFSCVAHVDSRGNPRTIANLDGDLLTPSVVFFDDSAMVVGKEALKAAMVRPEMIARWVKREMGKPLFWKSFDGESYPPEVIQSVILEKLANDAQQKLGPVKDAVITVPAYFSEPKRKATMDAGRLAGLNVLDIINEPTAAAIAFGVEQGFLDTQAASPSGETILVYDLGGGTFDVSVVRVESNRFRVIATDGDFQLGGIDWDQKIADLIADTFYNEHLVDLTTNAKSEQKLLQEAEDAKRSLSTRTELSIYFEHAGESIAVPLRRVDLNRMTAHLVERTRFTTSKVVRDAGLKWGDLTRILLVGGSTRMPAIVEMLEAESGMPVDRSLAADEAVAHGAAIYANLLARSDADGPKVQVSNVNSHDLGVLGLEKETGMHRTKVLLPRNTVLPAKHGAAFTTAEEGQQSVMVNVVEGGDASGNHATPIGRCIIRGLPPGLAAGTQVNVIFEYQNNGRLKVRASIPSTGQNAEIKIQRESAVSDAKLVQWGDKIRSRTRRSDNHLSVSDESKTNELDCGHYNDIFDLDDFLK
ncbi:Hsp70 family protein [Neorhodopirellula pilleata]|uniref:Chaperone protein DnaK n=1 Tax=Neorhodopirellula pilleata TaxID=2714738 RepID=A0A5C6AQ65_9BACT|nr:Hsp70 family protein [Neorhodopirellula pilleata]TWU02095.1 Chaperone protein DnaK [Neorhodopirellula pilleata]